MYGIPPREQPKIQELFKNYAEDISQKKQIPPAKKISDYVREATAQFVGELDPDNRLLVNTKLEYYLFKLVEFEFNIKPVDDICNKLRGKERFDALNTRYLSMQQSRKVRAGLSTENHVEYELIKAGLNYSIRKACGNGHGRPDLLLPGVEEYRNTKFPSDHLIMVEIKRTTKERWREVLKTAPRAEHKYLLVMEEGLSTSLLDELGTHGFSAIIPTPLQKHYPIVKGLKVYSLQQFMEVAGVYQERSRRQEAS